jgi:hypothetical protein
MQASNQQPEQNMSLPKQAFYLVKNCGKQRKTLIRQSILTFNIVRQEYLYTKQNVITFGEFRQLVIKGEVTREELLTFARQAGIAYDLSRLTDGQVIDTIQELD